jgi:16S rRNA (uracil1498-N3)-methyltransferase
VDTSNPLALQHVARKNNSYLVLIGPEGDFSQEELDFAINHHFTKVSLGESRLRTETAGMAACHILNLVNN